VSGSIGVVSLRLALLVAVSGAFIVAGVLWWRAGLRSGQPWRLEEDLQATFLRPRLGSTADLQDGRPRRIAPFMLMVGGILILAIGLCRASEG
jgi:hypothetical protein